MNSMGGVPTMGSMGAPQMTSMGGMGAMQGTQMGTGMHTMDAGSWWVVWLLAWEVF
jgi:hypothetical protein